MEINYFQGLALQNKLYNSNSNQPQNTRDQAQNTRDQAQNVNSQIICKNSTKKDCFFQIIGNFYVYNMPKQKDNPKIIISKSIIRFSLSTYFLIILVFALYQTKLYQSLIQQNFINKNKNSTQIASEALNRKLYFIDKSVDIQINNKSTLLPKQRKDSLSNFQFLKQNYNLSQFYYQSKVKIILLGMGLFWIIVQIIISIQLMIVNPGLAPLKQINQNCILQKNICHICNRTVDTSTYHCNECQVCFTLHQHHCCFLGKCITKKTMKLVKGYLFLLIFGLISTVLIHIIF